MADWQPNTDSGAVDSQPESPAAAASLSPLPAAAVGQLITATHRTIAAAHEHGAKRVSLANHLVARLHFAAARRLARLAWRVAEAGRRRIT